MGEPLQSIPNSIGNQSAIAYQLSNHITGNTSLIFCRLCDTSLSLYIYICECIYMYIYIYILHIHMNNDRNVDLMIADPIQLLSKGLVQLWTCRFAYNTFTKYCNTDAYGSQSKSKFESQHGICVHGRDTYRHMSIAHDNI